MEDENEYKKLPTEDKCVHKLWKARLAGYEEALKLFNQIDDEKSPEWNKYLGLIKKFVTDGNVVAQEKGMEAALVFVENCFHAGKTTGEVMSGIVAKCMAAPKAKTKDLALQITLMYVEIEKHEIVQEELMKGMEQKNPKVVAACINALTTALKLFGNKVITIKPMVKKIPVLLADRDKGVRDEMKSLVVEMHRWIGAAIEPHIAPLQAVVQQELRQSFTGETARPERYLRSQQQKVAAQPAAAGDGSVEEDEYEDATGEPNNADPYDYIDPVEILSKLPKDFYEKLEAKKWQDRKEALDALEAILKNAPKLEPGDYADLVRALKKVISKDTNVMIVALAGRLLGQVAKGLRTKFSPYACACVQAILEKFKEKKPNVVAALREAIDAIYPSTNLEVIMEDMLAAFDNKNPSIKAESSLFLARALCVTQPAAFNKKLIKAYVGGLMKLMESADPSVREAAAEALGTATKLVGEKNIAPHIGKIDNLKEQKIKEFADKAEIQVKVAAPKKEVKAKPSSAPVKAESKPIAKAPAKRPAGSAKRPVATKKAPSRPTTAREVELAAEQVDAKAEEMLAPDVNSGLSDANWKTRLSAVQSYYALVQGLSPEDQSAQLLLRIVNRKPGLKETNIQVLKLRLELVKYVADNFVISTTAAESVLYDIINKLGEASCAYICFECLTSLTQSCGLEFISNEGLSFAMDQQKNPKVQSELINWLTGAVKAFGFTLEIKSLIPHLKKALSATNPNVRTSAVNLIGVLSLYVGPSLINHFDGEKPQTKQLISLEIDKYANSSPPTPTRQVGKVSKSASKGSLDDLDQEPLEDEPIDEPLPAADDSRPRTDIAPLITDALIQEIIDKNWKVRNEALEKLKTIITTSSPIKATLGELPPALTARILDSNSKLAQTALQICENLATAMGPRSKQHVRTFFPSFFQAFGDNKAYIRAAAISCMETWCNEAGSAVAFEGEMFSSALVGGSPAARATLLGWLPQPLNNVPPKSLPQNELMAILPTLYICLEERSADVRKAAAECVYPVMLHLGYDVMARQMEKVKPASKTVVQAALEKARASLPVQPLPAKAKKEDSKGVKTGGAMKKEQEKKTVVKGKVPVKPSSASARSKKDDEESSPLLPNNNAKNQRIIDDQKLKVLKWNFTTPREEFFDLLKEQMSNAGVNKLLIANMFHADFRYHLKAIESLSEDLHENGSSLMANLDLVLKWLTLRFFDTNPSVILKGLEYLSNVFTYLIDNDYTMPEYEANCFIPYLVLKVGDPKDTVRNGVKALFKQIGVVYSVTKLFGYLMEGLKSKNARQRAECLECIGHLLETYGSSVMSNHGPAALKEMARHIGDRDNGVRSAALNCVAAAYFLDGERVYKMIGQISDKDLSLLEERIKRASKTRSAEVRRSMLVPLSAAGRPILPQEEEPEPPKRVISVETTPGADYEEEDAYEDTEPVAMPPPPAEPKMPTGPFGLDPELIAQLDAQVPKLKKCDISAPDLKFLDEPIPMPKVNLQRHAMRPAAIGLSPTQPLQPSLLSRLPAAAAAASTDDTQLADTIHSIASPDVNVACCSMSLITSALTSGRGPALSHLAERIVCAAAAQATLNTPGAAPHVARLLTAFYETAGLGRNVPAPALATLLSSLLRLLGGKNNPDEKLVRILNNVCVRVLEHSHPTHIVCAIVSLLHDSIGVTDPEYPRYQDLLLKCFWKILKMMSSWDPNSLDYDAVLFKTHLFYKAYPNNYWKKNPDMSDTPYRTVKTLVHTLVKMKGTSITNHLTQIPDLNESEIYPYLLKVFKQLKLDDKKENIADAINGPVLRPPVADTRLPRGVHEQLASILNNIGNKHHNKDAIQQLYDLRERHPEVDIWTYMAGSSFYFRNYVERALKEVADQRRDVALANRFNTDHIDVSNENEEKTHDIFLEKLRALQAKAGIKVDIGGGAARSPMDSRALADSINDNLRTHTIDPQLELNTTHQISQRNEADVGALRLKLQQIKSSSRK